MDYNEYVRQQGYQVDLSPIQKGIDSFMKNRKEAVLSKANELSNTTYSSFVAPWENFTNTDVGSWDISTLPTMTAGQALEKYKASAKEKGQKVYNQLLNAGAFDPRSFKEEYEKIQQTAMPTIERKLESYQQANNLSSKQMSKFIQDKGLQDILLMHASDTGQAREWATPGRTWKQWAEQKGGPLGIAGKTGMLGLSAGGGYALAKGAYSRFSDPEGVISRQNKKMTDILEKSEYGKKYASQENLKVGQAQSFAKGQVTKATKNLEKSEKLLQQAKDKFIKGGGKAKDFKGDAKLVKEIKNNKAALKKANEAFKTAQRVTPKGLQPLVDRVVKKYGRAGAIRMLAKKVGTKAALSMVGKGLLGATGVGAPVAMGLLAADAYFIYNTLKELAE